MCFLWNSIKIHFSPPGKGSWQSAFLSQAGLWSNWTHRAWNNCGLSLSLQTPTFKKPRSRTSTAERGGIWAASTQNCRTYRGSWWRTSRRCCREERRFPVSVCHLCSGQTEPWWEFSLRACAYPAPSQPPFTFFSPSAFSSSQHSTPRPATCPACRKSTEATPSIWIPAPPMPSWQLEVSFSSCSLSTYASGGSKRGKRKRRRRRRRCRSGKMGCLESADTKKSCQLRLKTQDSCS